MATYNTGNSNLDTRLNWYAKTFGVTFNQEQQDRWAKELAGQTVDGRRRSLNELGQDILKHVVTRERIEQWAKELGVKDNEMKGVVDNLMSGERTFRQAIEKFGGREGSSGGTGGTTDSNPKTLPGVMAGGQTIKVGSRFYQIYEFPQGSGQFVSYQFNDLAQARAALGTNFPHAARSESWYNSKVMAEAEAEEVVGQSGNWASFTRDIMRDAAVAAGIHDPSMVGRMMSNPEMQQVMAKAMLGDWEEPQILAAQRNTSFWKNVLYPGIENFYSQTDQPEQMWRDYRNQVIPALTQLGYEPGADGTMNAHIKRMLDNKIDSNVFLSQVPTFVRATQNAEFATVLNQWAERDLGRNIKFGDWFALMAGESQPELEAVAERATLEWVANNQGTRLSQSEIRGIAERTQLDPMEAQRAFAEFNQGILALGDEALGRYGLDRDTVLSAAVGVAPTDGRSIDEIKLMVAKTARELGAFDDEKINFYVGFDPTGRPQRPGLQALSPEGA